MHVKPRSYLTAGIAALGAGAIALTPVQPIPHHVAAAPQPAIQSMAVNLAATVNPIAAWLNTGKTTVANGVTLLKFYFEEPIPLLQTWAANQITYVKELFSGNANLIPQQIKANIQTLLMAPLSPGATTLVVPEYVPEEGPPWEPVLVPRGSNLSNTQLPGPQGVNVANPFDLNLLVLQLVGGLAYNGPSEILPWLTWDLVKAAAPVWRLVESRLSGLLLGAVGPLVSPLVSLGNSFKAFAANLKDGKLLKAVYEIINIPANMTNALLNGAGFTDLSKIVNRFAELPEGTKVGINMGGLLNAVPKDGSLVNPANRPTVYTGGTLFDGLFADVALGVFDAYAPGLPVGLGGSMVGMGQYLAPKLRVTLPQASTAAAESAAAAVEAPAIEAPAVEAPAIEVAAPAEDAAPAVSAPSRRKARAAAASDGDNDRAGGNSRSARSSR